MKKIEYYYGGCCCWLGLGLTLGLYRTGTGRAFKNKCEAGGMARHYGSWFLLDIVEPCIVVIERKKEQSMGITAGTWWKLKFG